MVKENFVNELAASVAEAAQKKQQEEYIRVLTRIISHSYDRAAAYTNLIILAGYAGMFTLWSFTKDYLNETIEIFIALMVGASLFIFCAWEVYKMIYSSRLIKKQAELVMEPLAPKEFQQRSEAITLSVNRDNIKLHNQWLFVLTVTIILGFGGASILMGYFVIKLLGM